MSTQSVQKFSPSNVSQKQQCHDASDLHKKKQANATQCTTVNGYDVETYFTQLKISYLMTTFRCTSDILITSWLFTACLQEKGEQCNSQVGRRPSQTMPWKRTMSSTGTRQKVVDREAQRQTRWIKEALCISKTPMCMNRDAGSYQLSHTWDQVISRSHAPSSCKQSRCDQDVRRTSKGETLSLGNIFSVV